MVAVVHGKAMGGGLAACLNADYRIAHEGTLFNYGNLPRGVCPGLLLSHTLGMAVGHKNATDLYMNDITATAHEAQGMGLVNEVCIVWSPRTFHRASYFSRSLSSSIDTSFILLHNVLHLIA